MTKSKSVGQMMARYEQFTWEYDLKGRQFALDRIKMIDETEERRKALDIPLTGDLLRIREAAREEVARIEARYPGVKWD